MDYQKLNGLVENLQTNRRILCLITMDMEKIKKEKTSLEKVKWVKRKKDNG